MKTILPILLSLLLQQLAFAQCPPRVAYEGVSGDFIQQFTLGEMSNINSGDHPCDYSIGGTTTLQPGIAYRYSVQTGSPTLLQDVRIWADLNRNGSFMDPGDELFSSSSPLNSSTILTGFITIPVSTIPGVMRMRIASMRSGPQAPDPCFNDSHGEYEDYIIQVNNNDPCRGTPSVGVVNTTCCTASPNQSLNIYFNSVPVESGINYQWQSSSTASGPWTAMPGQNSSALNTSVAAAYYRCELTCKYTGSQSTSSVIAAPCFAIATPVELISFTGTSFNQKIRLDWSTASEINHAWFELERSADGEFFTPLSKPIPAQGDDHNGHQYSYEDCAPLNGQNFYRLKQTDIDQSYRYSHSVRVDFNTQQEILLYPNPAQDRLFVDFNVSENTYFDVFIYDMMGRRLFYQIYESGPTYDDVSIPISDLPNGIYFFYVLDENGHKSKKQFVKF